MGTRRGAVALYLDIEHRDIKDFLNTKDLLDGDHREKIDCNIAVMVKPSFMEKLYAGEASAVDVWATVLELRMKFGSPYIQFMGNCWNADPAWYKDKGLKTGSSNLCLAEGTMVQTANGAEPIENLVGREVIIYDGQQWVKNDQFFYQGRSEVIKVTLSNGESLVMTPDHRCLINGGVEVLAKNLREGAVLTTCQNVKFGHLNTDNQYWSEVVDIDFFYNQETPVYCTHVPSTGYFALANGILTGNCNEIMLHHDEEHTYACVLSSINLDRYYEWKDYIFSSGLNLYELIIFFLDAVNEDYIVRGAKIPGLERAIRGAIKGRPLGAGVVGLHSLYMQQGFPWDSAEAYELNREIFYHYRKYADRASKTLASFLGEPEWCKGYGRRNTHTLSFAPTMTNSVLSNANSPGIEPIIANYYSMAGAKGTFTRQNKYLVKLLEKKGKNTGSVWASIRANNGSVQHLPFLTEEEKEVFKTAFEIDQFDIIYQAADRQYYIDQGQSLNLFISGEEESQKIMDTHLKAEKTGVKGLYYVRSSSVLQEVMKEGDIDFAYIKTRDDCPYCQKAKKLLQDNGVEYIEEIKPEGRVPEIWIKGEKLDDGYTSLKKRFLTVEDVYGLESDCESCDG